VPETFARTVREAMHEGCECIGENRSVLDAAKRQRAAPVGERQRGAAGRTDAAGSCLEPVAARDRA
jgi:hypothetical protein